MKTTFNTKFFQKKSFNTKSIDRYFGNAIKDFKIASKNKDPEVIFIFSYSTLIKLGITLISLFKYRVKSRQGHHVKIIEKLSQILEDKDIRIMGEKMRKKRNLDLYDSGIIVSSKEAKEYLSFIRSLVDKTEKYLKSQDSLF